ncbi:hypothetical protein [Antrihabitans sp. YC2-6]|uniref:hypothetical protein n=1 Tax=Antrihabitans sp. YC2-6 TaxID=2799498 RepID=UPI0018F71916|nr:hypothetical protein [Antrihabitans sp. YC2-6]
MIKPTLRPRFTGRERVLNPNSAGRAFWLVSAGIPYLVHHAEQVVDRFAVADLPPAGTFCGADHVVAVDSFEVARASRGCQHRAGPGDRPHAEGLGESADCLPLGYLEQRTHAVFVAAAQYFEGDPRRVRIAFRETLGDDTLRHNATVVVPAFVLFAAAHVGAGLQDQVSLGEGNLQLTISSLSGAFVMVYLDWLEGRLTATRDQIAAHCTTLVLNSLRVQHMPPTRSASN